MPITLLSLLFIGCSSLTLPKQSPFLAIEMTEDAFTGPSKAKNGVFFYSVDPGEGVSGPILEIYFVRNGKVTQYTDGGSTSSETIEAVRKIGFQPFDYGKEKSRLDTLLKKQAERKGQQYYPPIVLDGCEYRITYDLDGVKFSMTEWNPGSDIYFYADHSNKFRKLRDVLNELCIYYGRLQFEVY